MVLNINFYLPPLCPVKKKRRLARVLNMEGESSPPAIVEKLAHSHCFAKLCQAYFNTDELYPLLCNGKVYKQVQVAFRKHVFQIVNGLKRFVSTILARSHISSPNWTRSFYLFQRVNKPTWRRESQNQVRNRLLPFHLVDKWRNSVLQKTIAAKYSDGPSTNGRTTPFGHSCWGF